MLSRQPLSRFLSTLSLRRATSRVTVAYTPETGFLSTLSLRRATANEALQKVKDVISIHALLAESDRTGYQGRADCPHFYPRSPCGERQADPLDWYLMILISIHALLAESDDGDDLYTLPLTHFYPRSPCGERRYYGGDKS